jgi:hypothetical protein
MEIQATMTVIFVSFVVVDYTIEIGESPPFSLTISSPFAYHWHFYMYQFASSDTKQSEFCVKEKALSDLSPSGVSEASSVNFL